MPVAECLKMRDDITIIGLNRSESGQVAADVDYDPKIMMNCCSIKEEEIDIEKVTGNLTHADNAARKRRREVKKDKKAVV